MTITDGRLGFLHSKEVNETIEDIKSFLVDIGVDRNDRESIERCANRIVGNALLYLRKKQRPRRDIELARKLSKKLSDFLDSDEPPEGWENWQSTILLIMTYLPHPKKPKRGRSNLGTEKFQDDLIGILKKALGKVPTQTQINSLFQILFGTECTINASRALKRARQKDT